MSTKLKARQSELAIEIDAMQTNAAEKRFTITFDNLKRAVIYGSAMASFCVEKFGTERLLEVTQIDIDLRVKKFNDLSSFDLKK